MIAAKATAISLLFSARFRLFSCSKCATKHYKAHNAMGHGSTFDPLFKQSGRSVLLSAPQSMPRLENKRGFVRRSCPLPSALRAPPPHSTKGGGPCVSLPCPVARYTLAKWFLQPKIPNEQIPGSPQDTAALSCCQKCPCDPFLTPNPQF